MRPAPERLEVQVVGKTYETADIALFELALPAGGELPAFTAGAHVEVFIPGAQPRLYSLCNAPEERHRYSLGVLRSAVSRGGSNALHSQVQVGDRLTISTPRNRFPLHPAARSLLFAGGIGITPLLSMAEQLARSASRFELHYCAKDPAHAAFLQRLALAPYRDSVFLHFDDTRPLQQAELTAMLGANPTDTHLYVCGPQGFMEWIIDTAQAHGWPAERLHRESFGTSLGTVSQGDAFEVELKSSGAIYTVPPDKSVATVLGEAGIDLPLSCGAGVCGTCVTRVLDGVLDHQDSYLTDEERARNDCFTPCCSRALSTRILLDL